MKSFVVALFRITEIVIDLCHCPSSVAPPNPTHCNNEVASFVKIKRNLEYENLKIFGVS